MIRGLRADDGSSPLARGLQSVSPEFSGSSRIIPARAGFTVVVMHRWGEYGDHPRSRGVYPKS